MTVLLGRTIYDQLHRSRPGKFFNVFKRTSFASSRVAMSDGLPANCMLTQSGKSFHYRRDSLVQFVKRAAPSQGA